MGAMMDIHGGGQKKAWKILVQYKELTAFLQVVDGTQDSAASLPKAATVHQLSIGQIY